MNGHLWNQFTKCFHFEDFYIYGKQKMGNIVDDAKSNQPKAAMVQFKANHEQTKVSKLDKQN